MPDERFQVLLCDKLVQSESAWQGLLHSAISKHSAKGRPPQWNMRHLTRARSPSRDTLVNRLFAPRRIAGFRLGFEKIFNTTCPGVFHADHPPQLYLSRLSQPLPNLGADCSLTEFSGCQVHPIAVLCIHRVCRAAVVSYKRGSASCSGILRM